MSLTYIPKGGALVETCTRTVQGRLLLRPGPEANELIVGAVGRALEASTGGVGEIVHCEIWWPPVLKLT